MLVSRVLIKRRRGVCWCSARVYCRKCSFYTIEIQKSLPKKQCVHDANGSWMFTRQFFLILVIPLLLCSTIDANARVSSQSTITVHETKHTLNIIYGTGTADNSPDPCVPSLCYMSAYLHAFRLHTIYPTQPFDADNGCNNQNSADYCYGWLEAATAPIFSI